MNKKEGIVMENSIKIKLKGLNCPHCAEKITTDIKKLKQLQILKDLYLISDY